MTDPKNAERFFQLSGITIPFYESIFTDNIVRAIRNGYYEDLEAKELPNIVEAGDRVLELGAGIGFISALLAKDGRPEAIRTYEANPHLIPVINDLHELNGISTVEVFNTILSNEPNLKEVPFYIRRDFWASSSTLPAKYDEVISVPVTSFSKVVEEFRPTLIVCDIEGGELEIFRNANLAGVKKIYVEIHQRIIGRSGVRDLFNALSSRGFHYDQFHSNGSVILFSRVDAI